MRCEDGADSVLRNYYSELSSNVGDASLENGAYGESVLDELKIVWY
jgi:hypothetical protein